MQKCRCRLSRNYLTGFLFIFIFLGGGERTACAETASQINAGDGIEITISEASEFRRHLDGSVSILRQPGLAVTAITPVASGAAEEARNGAMWEPFAGLSYTDSTALGFDGRQVDTRNRSRYDAAFNVAPAATGKPFMIPGEGSLVVAISRLKELALNYQKQRNSSGQPISRYKVIQFVDVLPPEGSFRAATRGPKTVPATWSRAQVLSRLDTVFPQTLQISDDQQKQQQLLAMLEVLAAQGTFSTGWTSEPLAASEGVPFYGASWSRAVGYGILDLMDTTTDDALREDMALALTQIGIDLAGIVKDGGYWQSNGGHTHGRILAVLTAGLLLDDPTLVAMATDPLGVEITPGQKLTVYPFSEQRTIGKVVVEPRTEGVNPAVGDQLAKWGHVIGSSKGVAPLSPAWLGEWIWCISPDRGAGYSSNGMHPYRRYWGINSRWHVLATVILENLQPGDFDLSGLDGIKASGCQAIYDHFEALDGPGGKRMSLTKGYDKLIKLINISEIWTGPPAMALPPYLEVNGETFSAIPHGWQPDYGSQIVSRDLRFRVDKGEWMTLSAYKAGSPIAHQGGPGTVLEVQIRAVNAKGPGPWSGNMPGSSIKFDPEYPSKPKPSTKKPMATVTL